MMIDVGLFGHPRFYGARHEDAFLISHDGKTERLTDLPMRVYFTIDTRPDRPQPRYIGHWVIIQMSPEAMGYPVTIARLTELSRI